MAGTTRRRRVVTAAGVASIGVAHYSVQWACGSKLWLSWVALGLLMALVLYTLVQEQGAGGSLDDRVWTVRAYRRHCQIWLFVAAGVGVAMAAGMFWGMANYFQWAQLGGLAAVLGICGGVAVWEGWQAMRASEILAGVVVEQRIVERVFLGRMVRGPIFWYGMIALVRAIGHHGDVKEETGRVLCLRFHEGEWVALNGPWDAAVPAPGDLVQLYWHPSSRHVEQINGENVRSLWFVSLRSLRMFEERMEREAGACEPVAS
jgi:hypothetical protein